jgi:hypothetical protein
MADSLVAIIAPAGVPAVLAIRGAITVARKFNQMPPGFLPPAGGDWNDDQKRFNR